MNLIYTLSIVYIWFEWRKQDKEDFTIWMSWIYYKTDFKPFNCPFCLTTWIGLAGCYFDPLFLSLPILYETLNGILRRL